MRNIAAKFDDLRRQGRKGFIPFVSAGDPDLATSFEIVKVLAENGADIIELGVPFSDPMADGPTIQTSSQRALANRVTVSDVLDLVRQLRRTTEVPIVLFSYLNPLYRYGIERLSADAKSCGVDGVLVTDVVDDEASVMARILDMHDLDLISLVAPTTSDARLEKIASRARGFIYALSRAGVTGARRESSTAAETLVARVRRYTALPVAVGFGISTREQIAEVWRYADAAIVGSAIVSEIERSEPDKAPANVAEFLRCLLPKFALDNTET